MTALSNFIWISLESIRFDHTSFSDYHRNTTPRLARLAEEPNSTAFSKCIAHGKWTGTSSASILTGTTPPTHQIYGSNNRVLSDGVKTIPELLPDEYATLSIISNPNAGPARGLDRGFDQTRYVFPSRLHREVDYRTLVKSVPQLWRHGGGFSVNMQRQKGLSSYMEFDMAKRFVRSRDEPYFLYLHPNSTHHPYMPPKSLVERYLVDLPVTADEALNLSESAFSDVYDLIANENLTGGELDTVIALYDACLTYIDRCVGEFIETILETDEDTIIVVTGDHGDLLGEYGLFAHKFVLHDALTHVPMVTYGLDGVLEQADNVVQHNDIMTTALAQIGCTHDQLAGVDLSRETPEYAVSQRSGVNARNNLNKMREYNPDFSLPKDHHGMLTAVRSQSLKLLHSDAGIELFELPDETTDVQDEYPDQRDEMASFAERWMKEYYTVHDAAPEQQLDADIEKHLTNMGYLT